MLDGASRWQTLKAVVFPVLAPAFILIIVIVMVDVFNNADYTLLLMGPRGRAGAAPPTSWGRSSFARRSAARRHRATSISACRRRSGWSPPSIILPAAIFLALRNLRKD